MRPLAASPITLQLLAVFTSAHYKDLHAQEGTAMLQCWYMTNQWCHSESSSQCGSTRCHNCSHCLSTGGLASEGERVLWVLRCHEPAVSFHPELPTPSSVHAHSCRKATLSFYHMSTEVTDTLLTSFTRGARLWECAPSWLSDKTILCPLKKEVSPEVSLFN